MVNERTSLSSRSFTRLSKVNIEKHINVTETECFIIRKQRHLSTASISSEDSANLDELINGNFTTSMEEETDLNDLSLLDLDDSKEDFWKVDNVRQIFYYKSCY